MSETLRGWHGRTDDLPPTDVADLYLAPEREHAEDYAEPDGTLYTVTYEATNPLHLHRAADLRALWLDSAADQAGGHFHPDHTRAFTAHARSLGHDVVVLHPDLFDDPDASHDDWEFAVGTFGEPQTIVLNPAAVTFQVVQR